MMVPAAALQINADIRWGRPIKPPGAPPQTLIKDATRVIIARNDSPDVDFARSINPYRGCAIGCVYCFARPTHAYLGFSPAEEFETKIIFKPEAAKLLEKELLKSSYVCEPVVLGSNTDPYQPVERTLNITRGLLEVLERFNQPVCIVTKSADVLRDADILSRMAAKNLVQVYVSITTLDPALAQAMEPRAASPARRIAAIASLAQRGIPAGVLATPIIPGLNDAELEKILSAATTAGATHAGSLLLRLPHELGQSFANWLNQHMPDRAANILSLIRQSRSFMLNDSNFANTAIASGPIAEPLTQRFHKIAKQLGLLTEKPDLKTALFTVPVKARQLEQMAFL